MKTHRSRRFVLPLIVCAILLSACTIPTSHRYSTVFSFWNPTNGGIIELGPLDIDLIVIVPLPADYRPGPVGSPPILNNVTFFANAAEIGTANTIAVSSSPALDGTPGPSEAFEAVRLGWIPPAPGLYYIQARADLNLGTVVHGDYSYPVQICVVDSTLVLPPECVPAFVPHTSTPVPLSGHLPALPTITATPGSPLDCPAGTYFADVTHRCIAIQIVTKKPGGGDPNCSQYGSANSCSAAGCAWSVNTQSCH